MLSKYYRVRITDTCGEKKKKVLDAFNLHLHNFCKMFLSGNAYMKKVFILCSVLSCKNEGKMWLLEACDS